MNREDDSDIFQKIIEDNTKKMFKEWESLDKSKKPSQEALEFLKNVDELVRKETGILDDEIKIKKSIENIVRTRKDLGEVIIGDIVFKRVKIIDDYRGHVKPLVSIAYYQLLPEIETRKPIVRVLEWTVSHHPRWVIWFSSPVAKGMKVRTEGEYIVVHSLNEKESEDHNLLTKYSEFPCFGTHDGIDILLGYQEINEAIEFVEGFLPIIMVRNLYGDPVFLEFLQKYKETMMQLKS
jgi:hypothetical protein